MAIYWDYNPRQFTERTKEQLKVLNTAISVQIYTDVIAFSPVRTGRFRGNWHLSQGRERIRDRKGGTPERPSPPPREHIGFKARPYAKIWITNYTPYADYIEFGSSKIEAHYVLTNAVQRAYNVYGAS